MIPKQLLGEEFRFCLVGKDKRPIGMEWQYPNRKSNYQSNDPILLQNIKKGLSYGIVTGFNNLLVIDFDNEWAYKVLKDHLPDTFVVKTGGKSLHYYYYIDDSKSFSMQRDTGELSKDNKAIKETLIDFQGKGKQAITSGSTHASGRKYAVFKDLPIKKVKKKWLDDLIKKQFPKELWPNHLKIYVQQSKDDVVERIKREVKLTDYDPTLKSGSQVCPFHSDKSPSFSVFDNNSAFICFCGCGSGDVFNYVQLKENCDFIKAKEILMKFIEIEPISKKEEKIIENLPKPDHRLPFHPRTLERMFSEGIPPIEWRVWRILPKRGITFFGGASGSYKTWAGMHLALAISKGEDFLLKYPCYKANVLYLDEENGDISLFNRFKLLQKGYCLERPFDNLHLINFCGLKLDVEDHCDILDKYMEEHQIKVLIIDSMVRCMKGQEDKATDVRMVFDNLKVLLEKRKELSIVILHHTVKNGSKGLHGLRGSGDFGAFADVVFMFNPFHKKRVVEVEVAKHRHVDLSEFSNVNFEINKTPNGGLTLATTDEYTGKTVELYEECAERIWDYVVKNNLAEFRTGAKSKLFQEMEEAEYSKNCCYESLRKLSQDGYIKKNGLGKYQVLKNTVSEEVVN